MTFSFNFSNRDLKLSGELKHILFVNTGQYIIKGKVVADEFLVSSRLAAQHTSKQRGSSHIVALSQMDTKNVNALVKRLVKDTDSYIRLLSQIEALSQSKITEA